MKHYIRLIILLLAVCLTLGMLPVSAADAYTWNADTVIPKHIYKYENAAVGAGVSLTLLDSGDPLEPTGLYITGNLTVSEGAAIRGGGVLNFAQGASVTGLPLYYKFDDEFIQLRDGLQTLWDSGYLREADALGSFAYDEMKGYWYLNEQFEADPFRENNTDGEDPDRFRFDYATDSATHLYNLHLFRGVGVYEDGGIDYDLARPATRTEALVMLIRLLGKENEALGSDWDCPFTDVPFWATNYVGYAYANGLTNGVSATEFDAESDASAQMFLTFVLRALGYSDADGSDFTWDTPEELASAVGLLSSGMVRLDDFLRADAAIVSESALNAAMKNSQYKLSDVLVSAGVFDAGDYSGNSPDAHFGDDAGVVTAPVTLPSGVRTFRFTVVNVDAETGISDVYLSDGSYNGRDWQNTDIGWVKFERKQNALTADFTCTSDVDFENVRELKIRYTKFNEVHTIQFGCAIENGGRYWMDETAISLMTPKSR